MTYFVLVLVEPVHERENISRESRQETNAEEDVAYGWITLEPVVHDCAHACADEPRKNLRVR